TLVLAALRLAPPAPRPAGAPPAEFSAGRAGQVLRELAGDGSPHPTGSPANAQVRERVLAAFARLGYAARVEEGFGCARPGVCAAVQNVVAELPGREPSSAVLLAAHYDSVGAGAGISDDLAGVAAVLEVARALKAGPPLRHSVLFLVDDGEEAGLIGARAFAAGSRDMSRVRAVVNLEARGTSGPSLMFETGRRNRWLMPVLAQLPRPVTSSLFPALYEILPNDTDFSVFKERGLSGLNFAYLGDPARYHTAFDDLAHASPASLQHHGDNALAAVRGLAAADLARASAAPGRAVFFDILGFGLVWWPARFSLWIALAALLLLAVTAVRLLRSGQARGSGLAAGFAAWLGILLATAALGFGLNALFRMLGGLAPPWPARGVPAQATFWTLALIFVVFGALWVRRRAVNALWLGVWLGWAVLALVVALELPAASYLFSVPALVAAAAGLALGRNGAVRAAAALLPALVAGLLWFPLLFLLYDGLGTPALWLIGTLVALALTPAVPLVAGAGPWWRIGIPAAALLLFAIMAVGIVASPRVSKDSPKRVNIVYHRDAGPAAGAASARWLVTTGPPLPPEMRPAARFARRQVFAFPWFAGVQRSFVAPAPLAGTLPPPEVTVLSDSRSGGRRRLRLRLVSPRGAHNASLFLPASAALESARVAGHEVPRLPSGRFVARGGGWYGVTVLTLPPEGIEIELVLGSAGPVQATVLDRTPGVPPFGRALVRSRPATAAPIHDGDGTVVSRPVAL
ncbi:MAG TPA: M20/M25/M40 family metallo-hydrolase, partial [Thermoanaerobaculia bacterium]|nr:M20/M25/M40 family metallo-hydrolase [Thermoanaerobaculia bacterium]